MKHSLGTAAIATGKSKTTIHRAIKSGKLSAFKNDDGTFEIDPAELHTIYDKNNEIAQSKKFIKFIPVKLKNGDLIAMNSEKIQFVRLSKDNEFKNILTVFLGNDDPMQFFEDEVTMDLNNLFLKIIGGE
jgi:hypothetical protein